MPVRRHSLARRLLASLTLTNGLMILLVSGLYLWRAWAVSEGDVLDHLKDDALHLAEQGRPQTERHGAVFDETSGQALPGSDPDLVRRLPDLIGSGMRTGVFVFSTAQGPLYIAVAAADSGSVRRIGAVLHEGSLELEFWDWFGHELLTDFLPLFLPLLLVTLGVGHLTVRRAMQSVTQLSAQADQLGPAALNVRLADQAVPAEIWPLLRALNAALDRVEAGFASQRRFTANAAHELRTPLAVLTLRAGQIDNPALQMQIISDIRRMGRLVDQLLKMARLESGRIGLTGPVDLAELAGQVVADLFPLAHQDGKDISLHSLVPARLAAGNAETLQDALRNLVENAMRYSPPGGLVEVIVEEGPRLAVLDRGPGLPADRAPEQLFEPFERGSHPQGGSAGLGLSIVREVMHLHGGTAQAENRPGGGARFVMTFDGA